MTPSGTTGGVSAAAVPAAAHATTTDVRRRSRFKAEKGTAALTFAG
jgi:hypothetical protein